MESLREHYALTLRHWVRNLEENWDEAVALTSAGRARVWRLYMAASAIGFETDALNITQVLATKTTDGASGVELRPQWETADPDNLLCIDARHRPGDGPGVVPPALALLAADAHHEMKEHDDD